MKIKLYLIIFLTSALGTFSSNIYGYTSIKQYKEELKTVPESSFNPYTFIKMNFDTDWSDLTEEQRTIATTDLAKMYALAGIKPREKCSSKKESRVMIYTRRLVSSCANPDAFMKAIIDQRETFRQNPHLKNKIDALWGKDNQGVTEEAKIHLERLTYLLNVPYFQEEDDDDEVNNKAAKLIEKAGENIKILKVLWGRKKVYNLDSLQHKADQVFQEICKEKNVEEPSISAIIEASLCSSNLERIPSQVSSLFHLKVLVIENNRLVEISDLADLKKIQILILTKNQIKNILPLASLKNLEFLWLKENPLRSIIPLSHLRFLKEINLNNCQIKEDQLSVLKDMRQLELIDLGNNNLKKISALTGLVNLKKLYLSFNQIENTEFILNFPALTLLSLHQNKIKKFSLPKKVGNLSTLILSQNEILDLSSFTMCPNLQVLDLSNNKISKVRGLSSLALLEELNINNNKITTVSELSKLKNLKIMDVSHNQVDPSSVAQLIYLETLLIADNKITTVSELSKLKNLKIMDVSHNQVEPSSVAQLVSLEMLLIADNKISNIASFNSLVNLVELDLNDNQITDISVLYGMPKLKKVEIGGNMVRSFTVKGELLISRRH